MAWKEGCRVRALNIHQLPAGLIKAVIGIDSGNKVPGSPMILLSPGFTMDVIYRRSG